MQQLWGRVHRYGQTKRTWAFRLIAVDTFDEVMHAGGTGKVSMADTFLARPAIQSASADIVNSSACANIPAELLELSQHGKDITDSADKTLEWKVSGEEHSKGGAKAKQATSSAGPSTRTTRSAAEKKKTPAAAAPKAPPKPAKASKQTPKGKGKRAAKGKEKQKAKSAEPDDPDSEEETEDQRQARLLEESNAKADFEEETQIALAQSRGECHISPS